MINLARARGRGVRFTLHAEGRAADRSINRARETAARTTTVSKSARSEPACPGRRAASVDPESLAFRRGLFNITVALPDHTYECPNPHANAKRYTNYGTYERETEDYANYEKNELSNA